MSGTWESLGAVEGYSHLSGAVFEVPGELIIVVYDDGAWDVSVFDHAVFAYGVDPLDAWLQVSAVERDWEVAFSLAVGTARDLLGEDRVHLLAGVGE